MTLRKSLLALGLLAALAAPAHAQVGPVVSNAVNRQPTLTNTPVNIKTGHGTLAWFYCANLNTTQAYLQVYDAASVTVGTTTPKLSLPLGSSSGTPLTLWLNMSYFTALQVAVTATATGGTPPTNPVACNFGFQ